MLYYIRAFNAHDNQSINLVTLKREFFYINTGKTLIFPPIGNHKHWNLFTSTFHEMFNEIHSDTGMMMMIINDDDDDDDDDTGDDDTDDDTDDDDTDDDDHDDDNHDHVLPFIPISLYYISM